MAFSLVMCVYCGNNFLKDNRHINEGRKLHNKFYCSPTCLSRGRDLRVGMVCDNPRCKKNFLKPRKAVLSHNFCSQSCAAVYNNAQRWGYKEPKKVLTEEERRQKKYEGSRLGGINCWKKYKSIYTKDYVLNAIIEFVSQKGRIPVKREMYKFYHPARRLFGTWNNAIQEAGFEPNPILFANHHLARDGHKCDSLAEKIIDDFLNERLVAHERRVLYPKGIYTADFKIGNLFLEYFGLSGEVERYDRLKQVKLEIVNKYKIELIEVYPKDLYKKNGLEELYQKIINLQE